MVKHYISLSNTTFKHGGLIQILKDMFGLFNKKSEKEKLQKQYGKLLKEAHSLSTTNRKLSDTKIFEAEEIMKKIESLA